ncbi:phosphatase PAP2 family protein [Acinetobacter portensis]|uniref:phosphatase PAP2 family protein n=2 Tax=Acinetobacter portensis TaxID=1839785 RepID=UPI00128C3ADB
MPKKLTICGCYFLFISILVINTPSLNHFETYILKGLSTYRTDLLSEISIGLSTIGSTIFVLFITTLCAIYMAWFKKYIEIIFFFSAIFGSIVIAWTLKYLVSKPRPPEQLHLVESFGTSYPSAHSVYAATLGCLLIYTNLQHPKYKVFISFALLWMMIMGVSRVYLGVHFPSDVLSGWGIGLIWTSLLYLIFIKYCSVRKFII